MTSAEFSALLQGHEGRRCVCRTVTAWARPDNEVLQLSAGNDVSWSADGQFQAVQQIPALHFLFSASLLQLFAYLRVSLLSDCATALLAGFGSHQKQNVTQISKFLTKHFTSP